MIPEPLYDQIRRCMPIPCVDLVVTDSSGRVLLLERLNAPARGEWWFPGGRVLHGEARLSAAARKLREECGLAATALEEQGTYDLFLPLENGGVSHGITTVFVARVEGGSVRLDSQSAAHAWHLPREWGERRLHTFVRDVLGLARET